MNEVTNLILFLLPTGTTVTTLRGARCSKFHSASVSMNDKGSQLLLVSTSCFSIHHNHTPFHLSFPIQGPTIDKEGHAAYAAASTSTPFSPSPSPTPSPSTT